MAHLDLKEAQKEIDFEFFLDRESIPFKETRGVSGEQLQIKNCPDCGDDRWRTYMGVDSGQGNCFVCGRGFTNLSFIHTYLGADDWKVTIPFIKELMHEQGWRPKRKSVVATFDNEVKLPNSHDLPLEDGSNLAYLTNRGFTNEVCEYLHLKWCEFGWWIFKDESGEGQQNFANRVIIPVYDLDGSLQTFQGRDLTGNSDRKYLFPKGLPGTGRFLLNAQNVIATDEVVMNEGAFDVAATKIALDQDPDLRRVVPIGSFGKHLSYGSMDGNDQLGRLNQLKARGVRVVTIMWDGEQNALTSALGACKLLRGVGFQARIALLPKGKDPNEVLPEVVRQAYYEAVTWTPGLDIKWRLRNPYD